MNVAEAEELVARILEYIPAEDPLGARRHFHHARRRLDSDRAGLRLHAPSHPRGLPPRQPWVGSECRRCHVTYPCEDAARYEENLLRTAREYGVWTNDLQAPSTGGLSPELMEKKHPQQEAPEWTT